MQTNNTVHVHICYRDEVGSKKEASMVTQTKIRNTTHPRQSHVHAALGVLCCFALFVCLTLLASFFLPSHLSFKNMYMYVHFIFNYAPKF